jgi:DHA1 family inner membrane transport protein
MTVNSQNLTSKPVKVALATLALVTFVIGTAELMIVGILDLIAADKDVSIGTAGHLVTAYALGIAFGAPILSALTARFGRRSLLQISIAVFVAGNVLALVATSFEMLLVARILTGSLHGLIAGVATAMAASLVPAQRRGQAISLVVGGITVATVVGVPAGTLVGQTLGWQAAFVTVVALAGIGLLATFRFVPRVASPADGTGTGQARAAFSLRVLAMLGVAVVLMSGQFSAFTYVGAYLGEVTHVSGGMTSVYLLVFGVAALVGTLIGGRAADRSATRTLLAANAILTVAIGLMYLVGSSPVLAFVALAVWGFAGFALAPALLLRDITLAGSGAALAPTLGISAFNAGIAAGSLIGGALITSHGVEATMITGLIVSAAALPVTWASGGLAARAKPSAGAAVSVEHRRSDLDGAAEHAIA